MKRLILCALIIAMLPAVGAHAGHASDDVWLPSVGRGPGAGDTDWYTTLWIHNTGSEAATVVILYYPRGYTTTEPLETSEMVEAGATLRIANAVESLFGLTDSFGALRLVAEQELLVSSRIYAEPAGGEAESVGQFFAAVPFELSLGPGESSETLGVWQTDPAADSIYRYNFGFVEIDNDPVQVLVQAIDGDGDVVGEKTYDLGPYGALQKNISDIAGDFSNTNVILRFEVLSANGRIIAFGSGLANRSNDPSTFEMGFPDRTSSGGGGLTEVTSDASLVGDGTTDDPLGVAPGGITADHLARPLELTDSGSAPTLSVRNDGSGPALEATGTSDVAAIINGGAAIDDLVIGGSTGGINSDPDQADSVIALNSNSDVVVRLDKDAGGGSQDPAKLGLHNGADEEVFTVDENGDVSTNGGIEAQGDIATHGTVEIIVDGGSAGEIKLYPTTSTDGWVETYGSARATNGRATIGLPAEFMAVAATDEPYFVFLTPIGDRPLLVSLSSIEVNKFGVRAFDLIGGAGSGNFQYRVVARRSNGD